MLRNAPEAEYKSISTIVSRGTVITLTSPVAVSITPIISVSACPAVPIGLSLSPISSLSTPIKAKANAENRLFTDKLFKLFNAFRIITWISGSV